MCIPTYESALLQSEVVPDSAKMAPQHENGSNSAAAAAASQEEDGKAAKKSGGGGAFSLTHEDMDHTSPWARYNTLLLPPKKKL